jgi:hypothetical protein
VRLTACWILALLATGCGLRDYEERMREAQAACERCDPDTDLDAPLGPPLEGLPDIFFRPPMGMEQVTEKPPPNHTTYLFERRYGVPLSVTDITVTINLRPTSKVSGTEKILRAPGREPRVFRQTDLTRPKDTEGAYSQWILQGHDTIEVTLLFHYDKIRQVEALPLIEKSARSLTVGPEVEFARRAYARWGNPTRP